MSQWGGGRASGDGENNLRSILYSRMFYLPPVADIHKLLVTPVFGAVTSGGGVLITHSYIDTW